MKKEFLYSIFILPTLLLVGCEKLVQKPKVTSPREPIFQNNSSGEKTKILKGKDLKGAQLNAVDEQGRKLNFEIKDVELDPKDSEKKLIFTQSFIEIQLILKGRIYVLLMQRMSPRQFR
jgi:TolA-binding protein